MSASRQYHSATERIEDELRHEFHMQEMRQRDAWLILRMIDGRIPVDVAEVRLREWLLRRLRASAAQYEQRADTP